MTLHPTASVLSLRGVEGANRVWHIFTVYEISKWQLLMFASSKDTFIPYALPCQLKLLSSWDRSWLSPRFPIKVQNAQSSYLTVWCNVWMNPCGLRKSTLEQQPKTCILVLTLPFTGYISFGTSVKIKRYLLSSHYLPGLIYLNSREHRHGSHRMIRFWGTCVGNFNTRCIETCAERQD